MTKKIIFYLFLISHIAHGQVLTKTDSVNIKKRLAEVVVTGQISPINKKNAVQDIKIIGQDELNSGLYNNLADILSQQINIQLSQDNLLGSGLSMQGMSGQNVKILIDDIPVIGRLNGNIDLSQINLENIDRIEIVEGPLSVNYGTDALAGTINVITKKDYSENINSIFKSYYESVGRYNNNITISNKNNETTSVYELTRNYFSGWSKNDDFNLLPKRELADTNRMKEWKPKEQISNKIQYLINKEFFNSRFYLSHFYEKLTNRGAPRSPYLESAFDDYYYTFRNNFGIDLDYKFHKKKIKIILAYNNYKRIKNTFLNNLTTLDQVMTANTNAQDTSVFKLFMSKATLSSNNIFDYQIGLDLQKQIADSKRLINTTQEIADYAAFINIKENISTRFLIKTGLRIIYNTKYNAPIIPSFALMYNTQNIKVRGSYAKGFRSPTLKELFFEFVDVNHNIMGNESLLAEESNNYRLSANYIHSVNKNTLDITIAVFSNKIKNKIDLTNNASQGDLYSYFNIEEYITKGLSSNLNFKHKRIKFALGASYIGRDNSLATENENLNDLLYSPEFTANTIFNISNTCKFNLFYKYTGEIPYFIKNDNDNIISSYREDYQLINMSFNKYFSKYKLNIVLGVKNLLNVIEISNYITNTAVHESGNNNLSIGYGRSYFINIKFKL
jgi:outer membrane receptor for ferrienterochelin and colicins